MHATAVSQVEFYREFLMSRGNFDPKEFGVNLSRAEFIAQMCDCFAEATHGTISIDEYLFRPRAAARFCDDVRAKLNYHDVPDDIILRSIMNARKSGGA